MFECLFLQVSLALIIIRQTQNNDSRMSDNNNCNGIIFLATVLSKMSQMFTEINSIYLQTMLNKDSINMCPEFNVNTLLSQFQKDCKEKISSVVEEGGSENEQITVKNEQEKLIPSRKKKGKDKKDQIPRSDEPKVNNAKLSTQPPHPPPSSYLLFFKQHREQIAKQFPSYNVTELSKIASICWKDLSEQLKQPYHQRFNQEKQKYYEALRAYNLSQGKAEPAQIKQRGRKPKTDHANAKESRNPKKISQEKQAQRQSNADESDSHCDSSLLI